MSVGEYLSSRIHQVEDAIAVLGPEFDSHAFIEQYARMNETDYVDLLAANNRRGVFQVVHSEMAKFLGRNQNLLHIRKTNSKSLSRTIFGTDSPAEIWVKDGQ